MRLSHSFTLLTLILIGFTHGVQADPQGGPSRLATSPPEAELVPDTDRIARLPSSHEFESAVKTKSPWPWSPGNRPWIPDPNPDPKIRDRLWLIRKFEMDDGRTYGPLQVGYRTFSAREYPLEMPGLEKMYSRGELKPENFENYAEGHEIFLMDNIFRPEPQLLTQIQNRIHAVLRYHGWEPKPVMEEKGVVREGEYLWPPVKPLHSIKGLGLEVPFKVRTELQSKAMTSLRAHSIDNPVAWHLNVPDGRGGMRHIMMTKANGADLVAGGNRIQGRDFWLFHEAMKGRRGDPMLAMLGGMYLPKGAEGQLKEAGFAKPAFEDVLSRIH